MADTDWKFLGFGIICLILAVWLGFILGRLSLQFPGADYKSISISNIQSSDQDQPEDNNPELDN